ncbi:MAG: VTT domain-containing protein [Patescibacteria group bacterium]|jgi:uncharacterized membrane protein YdjX (TVP38/TMEM64 family)
MSSVLTKKHIALTLLVLTILVVAYWLLAHSIFSLNTREFNNWIYQLGWKAPLVSIALIMIEIIIPPLPGGWLSLANGYIFGSWLGFLYSYIGSVSGTLLLFLIVRKFGQPFVRAMMPHQVFEQYKHKIYHVRFAFGLLYCIPLFPVDMLTMLLGLTPIPFKKYLLLVTIGFIPNILMVSFFGSIVSGPNNNYDIIFLILVGIATCYLIIAWLSHRLLAKPLA